MSLVLISPGVNVKLVIGCKIYKIFCGEFAEPRRMERDFNNDNDHNSYDFVTTSLTSHNKII